MNIFFEQPKNAQWSPRTSHSHKALRIRPWDWKLEKTFFDTEIQHRIDAYYSGVRMVSRMTSW